MRSALDTRILQVIAYTDEFKYPLTAAEIDRRLFLCQDEPLVVRATPRSIHAALQRLVNRGELGLEAGLFFLPGKNKYVQRRLRREATSQIKRQELLPLVSYLQRWPWVLGVAITGSLAMNSAGNRDDADFLIITRPHRLWLTRLLVIFYAWKQGKRRSFANEEPNSWCFNLWLDNRNLFIPLAQHSLYTAYEACQAEWVINRHVTDQKFLRANKWVGQVLPYYYIYRYDAITQLPPTPFHLLTVERILASVLFVIDVVAYIAQRLYMLPHHTSERVGYGYAWFHPKKKRRL